MGRKPIERAFLRPASDRCGARDSSDENGLLAAEVKFSSSLFGVMATNAVLLKDPFDLKEGRSGRCLEFL
jgi:hypothetical protein